MEGFKVREWGIHRNKFICIAQLAKILSASSCKKKTSSKYIKCFSPIGAALPLLTLDSLIENIAPFSFLLQGHKDRSQFPGSCFSWCFLLLWVISLHLCFNAQGPNSWGTKEVLFTLMENFSLSLLWVLLDSEATKSHLFWAQWTSLSFLILGSLSLSLSLIFLLHLCSFLRA